MMSRIRVVAPVPFLLLLLLPGVLAACGGSAEDALGGVGAVIDQAVDDAIDRAGLDDVGRLRLRSTIEAARSALPDDLPAPLAERIGDELETIEIDIAALTDRLRDAESRDELIDDAARAASNLRDRRDDVQSQIDDADLPPEARAPLQQVLDDLDVIIQGLETTAE